MTTTNPTCTACYTTSNVTALVPCGHFLCRECYQSPLVLVSCYGCPACGAVPTGSTCVTAAAATATEQKEEQNGEWGQATAPAETTTTTTTEIHNYIYNHSYFYPTTTSGNTETCVDVPVAPAVAEVNVGDNLPVLAVASPGVGFEGESEYQVVLSGDYSVDLQGSSTLTVEDEKGAHPFSNVAYPSDCAVSCTSGTSSETRKKRRQKKKSAAEKNNGRSKFPKPEQPKKIVVPAGCPDDQRPRTRPEPKTCREAGRRPEREELLRDIHKAKELQKRRQKKALRDTC